jgi:hypothetical protein
LAGLVKATEFCGTAEHQAVALHDLLTKKKPELGVALGVLPDPDLTKEVGSLIIENAKEIFDDPRSFHRKTNNAMAFRKTGYFLMGPTAPPEDADPVTKQYYNKAVDDFVKTLGLTDANKKRG